MINLKKEDLDYREFLKAARNVSIKLNEEIPALSTVIRPIVSLDLSLDLTWVKIFGASDEFKEFPKLMGKTLSILISNSYVEKVFPVMKNVWTDLRNCMRVELVKAEFFTELNFDMTCEEFLSHPDKSQPLKKA